MSGKWILVWCATHHLESFRQELLDWFRDEGEVEREQETPEEQLAGVKLLLATPTGKGRGCLLLACQEIPPKMRIALHAQADILDYLIIDTIDV